MSRRIIIGLITGAILGVFCIIGATTRLGEDFFSNFNFAFWLNRVAMGLFFALLPIQQLQYKRIIRGLALGLFISFLFYASTDYRDLMGFFAGGLYGLILEEVLYRLHDQKQKD
jgi:hypothetical protein